MHFPASEEQLRWNGSNLAIDELTQYTRVWITIVTYVVQVVWIERTAPAGAAGSRLGSVRTKATM